MKEVWKDIDGYNGVYQVSSLGRVRSNGYYYNIGNSKRYASPKIISQSYTVEGYLVCSLTKDGKTTQYKVHRLIAMAFIPNPENKPQINHKNGVKDDNRLDDLEWATSKENTIHAHKSGLCKKKGRAYPVAQLDDFGNFIKVFDSARSAALLIKKSDSNLSKICRKGYGTCGGYKWKYITQEEYNLYNKTL